MTKGLSSSKAQGDVRPSRRVWLFGFGRSLVIGHWSLVIPAICLIFTAASPLAAAPLLSTNLPPISSALPDASFSIIRVFGALVLVIGLFLAGVWVFQNWQRIALRRRGASQLQILEMKALGGKHALYVVGYQEQRLLLASSPAGVTLVSHLPGAEAAQPGSGKLSGENFVQVLQQAVQAKA